MMIHSIHILKGASSQGVVDSYVGVDKPRQVVQSSSDPLRLRYFSMDRIAVEPGTTITIINDDDVSHSILD